VVLIGVAGISRALVHRRTASPATPGSTVRVPDLVPATDGGSLTTLARPTAAPSTAPVRALRRTVLVETVLALLVLGLTTMLVGQPPARTALHLPYAGTLALPGGRGTVQLSVAPATLGPDQVHVYVFDGTGQLADPQDVRVDADPPPGTASRVSVTLTRAGPAHFIGTVLLPATGTWQLRVRVALSEFEAPIVVAAVPVT
jgi:copper transport protein